MIMQKILRNCVLFVALAWSTINAMGQPPKGCFSIKPMAGVSVSTIVGGTDDDLYKTRASIAGGFEVEYAISDRLGLSVGASYLRQGSKPNKLAQTLSCREDDGEYQLSEG